MTLYKQLWIAILILLSIIFVGSVFTSSMSAQQYMERSVSGHNQNYANFLGLLLNSDCAMETCDKAHLETWLKPPMDQGYIRTIKLVAPDDEVLFDDQAPEKPGSAPQQSRSAVVSQGCWLSQCAEKLDRTVAASADPPRAANH